MAACKIKTNNLSVLQSNQIIMCQVLTVYYFLPNVLFHADVDSMQPAEQTQDNLPSFNICLQWAYQRPALFISFHALFLASLFDHLASVSRVNNVCVVQLMSEEHLSLPLSLPYLCESRAIDD